MRGDSAVKCYVYEPINCINSAKKVTRSGPDLRRTMNFTRWKVREISSTNKEPSWMSVGIRERKRNEGTTSWTSSPFWAAEERHHKAVFRPTVCTSVIICARFIFVFQLIGNSRERLSRNIDTSQPNRCISLWAVWFRLQAWRGFGLSLPSIRIGL